MIKIRKVVESLDRYDSAESLLYSINNMLIDKNVKYKYPSSSKIKLLADDIENGDYSYLEDLRDFLQLTNKEVVDDFDRIVKQYDKEGNIQWQ